MKRLLLTFLWAVLISGTLSSQAQDVSKPPTPREIESLTSGGYSHAASKISEALAAAYATGQRGRPGLSGNPAFAAWLNFYKACELLARPSESDTAALVRRHFFRERSTNKFFFLPPGQAAPDALEPLAESEAASMAAHHQIRSQLIKAAFRRFDRASISGQGHGHCRDHRYQARSKDYSE